MAVQESPRQTDKDLASIAEARTLARQAKAAQAILAEFSQAQIDTIVDAMAAAVTPHAAALGPDVATVVRRMKERRAQGRRRRRP